VTAERIARPTVFARPRQQAGWRLSGAYALLCLYALVAIGPFLLVLLGSFRTNTQIINDPLGLPSGLNLGNYTRAWSTASMGTYFLNSLVISVLAVALCTAVSVTAAYALARWRFAGRSLLAVFFISGLMLPMKLGMLPVFYQFERLGLIDSRFGLILLYAAMGIPFSVFVMMAFIRSLPGELDEAGRLDGAGEIRIFGSVMLPLLRPGLATVVVFQFAPTWNDFFYPLVLLRSSNKYTIPVGLTHFFGEHSMDRGGLYAGLILSLIPVVVLFAVASKQIVNGLTAGIGK